MKKNNETRMAAVNEQSALNVTRRRFLAGAGALLAAPVLAGLWPRSALAEAISQALPQFVALRQAESGILTGAHWGRSKPSSARAKWWMCGR